MSEVPKIICDENISDEVLSENVSSCKVPCSEKILENMSLKSLTMRKKTYGKKFSFNCGKNSSYSNQKRDLDSDLIGKKLRLKSFRREIEHLVISKPYDLCQKEESKQRSSLKQEISDLLKMAAEIRSKGNSKSKFAKQVRNEHLMDKSDSPGFQNITAKEPESSSQ